ncbi:lipoyl(octanoyl) transferase LipB [Actinocorallia longicatena]|uniref:Octanoyltransferase n=1 Tax=Actinocorallia longicatena TaxID=111803 RepID=A0ABP6QAF1_9ACTN
MIFVHAGFGGRGLGFERCWDLQRRVHARRVAEEIGDTVLVLEHPPVYTVGRGADPRSLDGAPAPIVAVDRAGGSTWHGPGQLTGYPVVRLTGSAGEFTALVAEALVQVCGDLGVRAAAVPGGITTGDGLGLATIGVRVAQGVTTQGFALNCDPDLGWYEAIDGAHPTSLSRELGRTVTVREVLPAVEGRLAGRLGAMETFHRTLAQLEQPDHSE